jgi:hypothetical protein
MTSEKMKNLITMMEVGVQRLREADNDMAVARVLRTMSSVCDHQCRAIERDMQKRIDDALAHQHLTTTLEESE